MPPSSTIRLDPDPSLRRRDRGRIAIGGSPLRFVRLTSAGATVVDRWLRGEAVPASSGTRSLAARLSSAGLLHPHPPDPSPRITDAVTVIVPVKDDADGLADTLESLAVAGLRVVVVDDGSASPVTVGTDVDLDVTVIRRARSGGPGVARQAGLTLAATDLVAFVDAGVVVTGDSLRRLAGWFADPDLVAVGPRIRCAPRGDFLAGYELERSPLDLGPTPAIVREHSPVTYLPTACLVVRCSTLERTGGFDPALRYGEDVDLVWRLGRLGTVRYDPTVEVAHPARTSVGALLRQRLAYGSSSGPLARRHGERLAPVRASGWSIAVWALAVSGRPVLASIVAAGTAVALRNKLAPVLPDPGAEAAVLAATGHWHAGRGLVRASTRALWPATLIAGAVGGAGTARRLVALSILDRLATSRGSGPERLARSALAIADDAAYGAGVWLGALRHRTLGPLVPRLVEWPPRDGAERTGRSVTAAGDHTVGGSGPIRK